MPDGIYALRDPSSGLPAFNMNNEFNLFGCKTSLTGRLQECFPVIDDEPIVKEVVKPVIEKRSWGLNLFVGVLATAALAAMCNCCRTSNFGRGLLNRSYHRGSYCDNCSCYL